MPRTLPQRVERLPCPSLRTRSASLRLNLPEPRRALERLARLTSVPSASARNLSSHLERTKRTRTWGPTWPPSFSPRSRPTSSRSRRPRRSPLSTLPSSGRPSRSWRRLRSAPSLLPLPKPHQTGIRISVEIRRKSDTLEPIHYPNCEDAEVAKKKTPVTSQYKTVLPKPCWLSLLVSSSTSLRLCAAD